MIYGIMYLAAIVLANLAVYYFGETALYIVAFLFIGLDLTARDNLHEYWKHKNLALKMFLLISAGGLLSYMLNANAYKVAIASSVAFVGAGIADTIVYNYLYNTKKYIKINASNMAAALIDSLLFPLLLFGGFIWHITLLQFLSKVLGGALWGYILVKLQNNKS